MKIHEIEGYIQSLYLVEYPDKLLLLDGGCRCDVATVREFVEESLGRKMEDLKLVVVTHMHPDHAGGAAYYQKKYKIPVASVDEELQWYNGMKGSLQHIIDIALAYWVASRKGRPFKNLWYPKNIKPEYLLKHKQTLPGFKDWKVFKTPGHTDRDITLVHSKTKRAYVGDVVISIRDRFLAPVPIKFPDKYQESLKVLADLNLSSILMAHGSEKKIFPRELLGLHRHVEERPDEFEIMLDVAKRILRSFA